MIYGLVLSIVIAWLDWLNSPIVWALFWAVAAIQLAIFARLTWQRTRMVWTAVSGVHASLVACALVPASLAGYTLHNLPSPWNVVFWINVFAVPALLVISWTLDRGKHRQWKEFQRHKSLLEMLRFRHIPNLR